MSLSETRESLKRLMEEIVSELPGAMSSFVTNKSPYVSHVRIQGNGYRSELWIGLAHKRFEDPRAGVQFQFGIDQDGVWSNGIWIDWSREALPVKRNAQRLMMNQLPKLIRLLRRLPENYRLELSTGRPIPAGSVRQSSLQEFIQRMGSPDEYAHIGAALSRRKAIQLGKKLPTYIVRNFSLLLPIYSLVTGVAPATKKRLPSITDVMPVVLNARNLRKGKRRRGKRTVRKGIPSTSWEIDKEAARLAELIVLRFERERLRKTGLARLARKVKDVSSFMGLGYDIRSWTVKGKEMQIEVKSTKAKNRISFYLTPPEWKAARKHKRSYCVYVVLQPDTKTPRIIPFSNFHRQVERGRFRMEPSEYFVSFSG